MSQGYRWEFSFHDRYTWKLIKLILHRRAKVLLEDLLTGFMYMKEKWPQDPHPCGKMCMSGES